MKIIIADNDFEFLEDTSVAFNLCIPEIELIATESGQKCLDILKDGQADIVILSLGLCDISCLTIINKIRDCSGIPIVVLSSKEDEHKRARALKAGANDYIAKPVKQIELIARIRNLVKEYKGQKC